MKVVSRLPKGVVVLPNIDVDLDNDSWRLIGDQHPQYALKHTLAALNVERHEVPMLKFEDEKGRARRVLMREALAPAEKTADWIARLTAIGGEAFVKNGASGLRLLEAATEDEEATAIALMVREKLEEPGGAAAIVTPDAGLARRIEAKLTRWGIEPSVSHGWPLRETDAGRLIALLCELAHDPAEPVALAALLKHPRVGIASDAYGYTILEHEGLRGARRHDTLTDLANLGERDPDKQVKNWSRARAIVEAVAQALAPLTKIMSQKDVSLSAFADALSQCAESLTKYDVWQGRDGEGASRLLRDANQFGAELGLINAYSAPRAAAPDGRSPNRACAIVRRSARRHLGFARSTSAAPRLDDPRRSQRRRVADTACTRPISLPRYARQARPAIARRSHRPRRARFRAARQRAECFAHPLTPPRGLANSRLTMAMAPQDVGARREDGTGVGEHLPSPRQEARRTRRDHAGQTRATAPALRQAPHANQRHPSRNADP
ncbi:MAG: hypothetical protein IPL62_07195 [Caulobacteraceae bacterium]|nr:hypothetical protein [Caulobacteraceae bacterium]